MCDYSLTHLKSRPAAIKDRLVVAAFSGSSTRGFRAVGDDSNVVVCLRPGTELAFEQNVKYDNRWIWTRTTSFRVGKFNTIDPHIRERHHDAIEFPDGSYVLVTQLCTGQRATVLQLPVVHPVTGRRMTEAGAVPAASASAG